MTASVQRTQIEISNSPKRSMQTSEEYFKDEIKKVIATLKDVGMNFAIKETNSVFELKYFFSLLCGFRQEFCKRTSSSRQRPPPSYFSLYPSSSDEEHGRRRRRSSSRKYHRGESFSIPECEEITLVDGSDAVFESVTSSPTSQTGRRLCLIKEEAFLTHHQNRERASSGSELRSFNFRAARHSTTSSLASIPQSLGSRSSVGRRISAPNSFGASEKDLEYIAIRGIDDVDAKSALCRHVSKKLLSPKKPAKNLQINNITTDVAWKYQLISTVEQRYLSDGEEPFKSQVASSKYDDNPDCWSIKVDSNTFRTVVKVPNTVKICTCPQCHGERTQGCSRCGSTGNHKCWSCNGDGRTMVHDTHKDFSSSNKSFGGSTRHETCHHCGGSGNDRCGSCAGSGRIPCSKCYQTGKVATFKKLTVIKRQVKNEYYTANDIPPNVLEKSTGVVVYQQHENTVEPLVFRDCCNQDIIKASHHYTKIHKQMKRGERLTGQFQTVSLIPLHFVEGSAKERCADFWVVGNERNVYNPNYPNRSLCHIM